MDAYLINCLDNVRTSSENVEIDVLVVAEEILKSSVYEIRNIDSTLKLI